MRKERATKKRTPLTRPQKRTNISVSRRRIRAKKVVKKKTVRVRKPLSHHAHHLALYMLVILVHFMWSFFAYTVFINIPATQRAIEKIRQYGLVSAPRYAMAVAETLNPNANGTYQEFSMSGAATHWQAVSDGSATSYIQSGTAAQRDTEAIANMASSASFVQQVDITMVCKATGSSQAEAAATMIRESSTDTEGSSTSISRTAFTAYTTSYTTNPRTGIAWTVTQVNALEAGVRSKTLGSGENVQCTEVYVAQTPSTAKMSSYRWFTNANSTDVGAALAAQNTTYTLTSDGQAFRLRLTMHVASAQLAINSEPMTLQFAPKSGTCDTAYSGESWTTATAATVIAFNDNATPTDGSAMTVNANDPSDGDTKVTQRYEELNNFQNSAAAIPSAQDGIWDFSLKDNGATDGTAYCFRVIKSDGNAPTTPVVVPEITIYAPPAPTVTGVSSSLANGSYKAGQVVPIDVTFSESVTVTGTPQITLTTGSPATTAINYSSGSPGTTLTFNYTVAASNTSADLDYSSTSALALNSGTINATSGGTAATLTLASPGAAGSLGANKNLVIDTTAPSISSTAPATNAFINSITTSSDVSYTLSEAISSGTIVMTKTSGSADAGSPHTCTLTGTALNTGAHNTFDMSNTTNGCTVAQSLVSGAVYTFAFNATDAAGNAATPVSNTGVTFDDTAPVISATAPATGAFINSITSSSDVSYTLSSVIASGSIVMTRTSGTDDGSSPHTCTLIGGAFDAGAHSAFDMSDTTDGCTSAQSLVSGTVYTFVFNATDAAGNAATPVTNTGVTFDDTAPTISSTTPATNASINSITTSSDVNYTLNEAIASGSIVMTWSSGTADAGSPHTCTLTGTSKNTGAHSAFDMSDTTNGCTVAQSLVSGAVYTFAFNATDAAGNTATPVSNTGVTFDSTAPTVSTLSPADNATGVSGTANLVMTMSETVNVNAGNVVIKKTSDNSTVETIAITSGQVTGTGTNTITINPSVTLAESTEYYVQVALGAVRDAALNDYAGISDTTSWSFTIGDTTAPTITNVSSDKANGTYGIDTVIDIDVTFSEAVTSTGNVTVELETGITDRTCTFTVTNATTGTCNYTVQAGDESSDLTVKTISGTIKDAALNSMTNFVPATNLAANKAIVIEATAPTVSTLSPLDNATGVSATANLVMTFSETVNVNAGNVVIKKTSDNSTVETIAITSGQVTGTGTNTITINPSVTLAGHVEYYVQVASGALRDAALNNYAGIADTTSWSFTIANTAPVGTFVSVAQTAGTDNVAVSINVSDSEGDLSTAYVEYAALSGTCGASSFAKANLYGTVSATYLDSEGVVHLDNAAAYQLGDATGEKLKTAAGTNQIDFVFHPADYWSGTEQDACLRFKLNDTFDDSSYVYSSSFATDTKAPTAPGNLTDGGKNDTSVTLTFGSASVDTNFTQYKIYYKQAASGVTEGNTEWVDTDLGAINYNTTLNTVVTSLTANTQYVFNIWAYDNYGHKSNALNEIAITTLAASGYVASGSLISASIDTTSYPTIKNRDLLRAKWTQVKPSGCSLTLSFRGTDAGGGTPDYTGVSWGDAYSGTGTTVTQDLSGVAALQGKQYFQYKVDMTNCNSGNSTPELFDIQLDFD